MPSWGKDIIPVHTVSEMVDAYNQSVADIKQAFNLIAISNKRMTDIFGAYNEYTNFHFNIGYKEEKMLEELKSGVWKSIVDAIGLQKILSEKRTRELEESLEQHKMPDITLQNVLETIATFSNGSQALQKELVQEVYRYLKPASWDTYKTNKRYDIGKKVILGWRVEHDYSGNFRCNYHHEDGLVRIDRVFHLLDGAGVPKGYRSPLVDAINTSGRRGEGETDYFKFKCYMNRNLHLEFKRLDLLAKLNAMCGNGTLKGVEQ